MNFCIQKGMISIKRTLRTIKQLSWTQRFAALICFLFLLSIALNLFTEGFRLNPRFRLIYQYGQLISIVLFYGTFLASLINSLLMTVEGSNWKKSLVWTLISSVPLLFMIISFVAWYFEV